jgi:uncharacterized protein YcaQ
MATLDRMTGAGGELVQYLAHQASLLDMRLVPLFRWRMQAFGRHPRWQVPADVLDRLAHEVGARGPITASELAGGDHVVRDGVGPWGKAEWRVSPTKEGLRHLYRLGRIMVAGRKGIEPTYDLPERVLPPGILNAPTPSTDDARRRLLLIAARAQGVAMATELADHFGLRGIGPAGYADRYADGTRTVAQLLAELVERGELVPATVEGWPKPAFVHPDAVRQTPPPGIATVVSPFDSLMWSRPRVERLFGFTYIVEIYVPEAKRKHGYYVLPFLLGDRLVARVDLKADRAARALLARGSWAEPNTERGTVATALAAELSTLAAWLGLSSVTVESRGDLAEPLRQAVNRRAV